jgi:surface antigen
MKKIISALLISALLAACSENGQPDSIFNKQNAGTLLGGATGGFIGSRIGGGDGKIVATAVGGVLGALIGSQIGKSLDESDRGLIGNTTYNALETVPPYEPAGWRNPQTGNYGEISAGPTYQQNGYNCRPFTQTIFVDGRAETARGNACKQGDGTWKVVNQ